MKRIGQSYRVDDYKEPAYYRKVIKQNGSYHINIPRDIAEEFGLQGGDDVIVIYLNAGRPQIVIQKP